MPHKVPASADPPPANGSPGGSLHPSSLSTVPSPAERSPRDRRAAWALLVSLALFALMVTGLGLWSNGLWNAGIRPTPAPGSGTGVVSASASSLEDLPLTLVWTDEGARQGTPAPGVEEELDLLGVARELMPALVEQGAAALVLALPFPSPLPEELERAFLQALEEAHAHRHDLNIVALAPGPQETALPVCRTSSETACVDRLALPDHRLRPLRGQPEQVQLEMCPEGEPSVAMATQWLLQARADGGAQRDLGSMSCVPMQWPVSFAKPGSEAYLQLSAREVLAERDPKAIQGRVILISQQSLKLPLLKRQLGAASLPAELGRFWAEAATSLFLWLSS